MGIIKVNLLEIGHEQHELLISLKSDLKSLESVQEVLDDDGGNVFQGALALVEMMLEIGYHSPGCTNEQPPVDSCSTGMKTVVPEGPSPSMVAGPDAQFDSHLQTNLTSEPNGKKVQYPRRIEDEPDLLDNQAVCQVVDQDQKGGDQPSPPLPHVGYEIGLEERPFPERDTSLAGADWREESSIPDGGISGLHRGKRTIDHGSPPLSPRPYQSPPARDVCLSGKERSSSPIS